MPIVKSIRRTTSFVDAGLTWTIKRTVGVLIHYVYAAEGPVTRSDPAIDRPTTHDGRELLPLCDPTELRGLSKVQLRQIGAHSGRAPQRILEQGERIYILMRGHAILSQLNVSFGGFTVSTPIPLRLELAPDSFFVSFLYTPPAARGEGHAHELMTRACNALFSEGYSRALCHIRSTNLPSRATVQAAGWHRKAAIVATQRGRLLGTPGGRRIGLKAVPQFKPRDAGDAAGAP